MEYSKLTTQEKLDLARHLYLLNRVLVLPKVFIHKNKPVAVTIKPIYI
jgi:hypothetical protein